MRLTIRANPLILLGVCPAYILEPKLVSNKYISSYSSIAQGVLLKPMISTELSHDSGSQSNSTKRSPNDALNNSPVIHLKKKKERKQSRTILSIIQL